MRYFENELKGLNQSLNKMGTLVSQSVKNACAAAVEGDLALAEAVIENDKSINRLEVNIDNYCMKLLALYQPAATDLRFITMAMRINSDLERIADLAVNISERTLKLKTKPQGELAQMIKKMVSVTKNMVSDTIVCFLNNDIELAEKIIETEDNVDKLNANIIQELVKYVIAQPKAAKKVVGYIFISKNLERLADHLENIAQDVIFAASGEIVRH